MLRRPTIPRPALAGLALGGLVAGHELAYADLVPDASARSAVLAQTGHAYLHLADTVAIVAALAAVVGLSLRSIRAAGTEGPSSTSLWLRLAFLQAAGYTAIEVAERVVSGSGFGGIRALLLVGCAIQVALAVVSGSVVAWLLRASRRIASLAHAAQTPHTRRTSALSPRIVVPSVPALGDGRGPRAPPLPV